MRVPFASSTEGDRRETSIFRIEDMGDYDVIRMGIGMRKGGHSDD
jgi:hypothetical protein